MEITHGPEPMLQLRNQGQILGPDGLRMSKSRGNVIEPDDQVEAYGADTVRAYLMFGYRWSEGGPWNPDNIQGVVRWLNRVWTIVLETAAAPSVRDGGEADGARDLKRKVHQTIRQVTHDLDQYEFNTVIAALMELTNSMYAAWDAGLAGSPAFQEAVDALLRMMAPVTPHIAEELWARLEKPYSIHTQSWPAFDPEAAKEEEITLIVQVNGKLRDRIPVPADVDESTARERALASEPVQRYLEGREPRQIIYVPGRLINIVI